MIAEDSDEINRHHAQLALLDDYSIMSHEVVDSVRAERRRAAGLHAAWDDPPEPRATDG